MYHKQKTKIKGYKLPPVWCAQICGNSMNELCIMECAPKRNAMHFEPKTGLRLADLPYFPEHDWNNNMTGIERQVCAGFYLARAIDYLQRRKQYDPPIRPNHDSWLHHRIPTSTLPHSSCNGSEEISTSSPKEQNEASSEVVEQS